ncbi:MAG: GNAT family N-acetyltransferase [Gammaproteobacteria bacterium]
MDIHIRSAHAADAAVIAEFNLALAEESEGRQLDPRALAMGVHAVIADPSKGRYFLAEHNAEVIGQLMLTFEWSDWRNGVFWWIQSVYVRKSHRGKGVFSRLFRHVRDQAQDDAGVCGLRLYVEKENRSAANIYLGLGMEMTSYDMLEIDFSAKH